MNRSELQREIEELGQIIPYKLREWADTRVERTFFYYGEDDLRFSYRQFNERTNRIAHALQSLGVEKGDRVSLFLLNPWITTLAMFGIWKIGAVFCPINFNYTGRLLFVAKITLTYKTEFLLVQP